jgi:hypothetical protein
VRSVKDNQPHLLEDMQACFAKGLDTNFAALEHSDHTESYPGHGRGETHPVSTIAHPPGLRHVAQWKDWRAITLLSSQRHEVDNEWTEEVRYYLGSKAATAKA